MAKVKSLQDLFVKELRDVYGAERQITKALPKMIKAASSEPLRSAFEMHLEETRGQIDRLEQVFEIMDQRARAAQCKGMAGIIEEATEMMDEVEEGAVADATLVAAAQKVEHYEICAYGTLETYASLLGNREAAQLLRQTLDEEKAADKKLTKLAESGINQSAARPRADEEDEEALVGATRSRRR